MIKVNIQNKLSIDIGNDSLDEVKEIKYLGVVIDRSLNFDKHITYIINKINTRIGMIFRSRKYTSGLTKIKIYETLVQSVIIYGLPLWSQCNRQSFQKLKRKIDKSLGYINNSEKLEIINTKKKLYTLDKLVQYYSLVYFFKTISGLNGLDIDCFHRVEHRYFSRSQTNQDYQIPGFIKSHSQKTFFYKIIAIYNVLPLAIKQAETISQFKVLLRSHLLLE